MSAITYNSRAENATLYQDKTPIIQRFFLWARDQERNHIAWVGVSIIFMTAFFFPITMSAILFNGASFKLIVGALIALAMVVIANLADLPTRITITAFALGVVIDLGLITASFFI